LLILPLVYTWKPALRGIYSASADNKTLFLDFASPMYVSMVTTSMSDFEEEEGMILPSSPLYLPIPVP